MKRRPLNEEELSTVRRRYPDERTDAIALDLGCTLSQVYYAATKLGLRKSDAYLASPAACRLRRGGEIGKAWRFKKGFVPANKGIKGVCAPGCVPTQFKKGHKSHTWKPIGSERVGKDGYLQRKLTDTGYPPRDWVAVHRIVWNSAGREIPRGFHLVFKDGNKRNFALENLELVSFADMMRRNTLHNYGKEIAGLVQLTGSITRQINRRLRNV